MTILLSLITLPFWNNYPILMLLAPLVGFILDVLCGNCDDTTYGKKKKV